MTILDVLARRADADGSRLAYTFLADGEREESHLTYGDLDRRARGIAAEGCRVFHFEPFVVMNKKDKRCLVAIASVAGRALVVHGLLL